MSKQPIVVGQKWREKDYNRRLMRVEAVMGEHPGQRVGLSMVEGYGKPTTEISAKNLRAAWELVEQAPNQAPPVVRLTLAPDTTATHCGGRKQRRWSPVADDYCPAFDAAIQRDDRGYLRAAACVAAQLKSP